MTVINIALMCDFFTDLDMTFISPFVDSICITFGIIGITTFNVVLLLKRSCLLTNSHSGVLKKVSRNLFNLFLYFKKAYSRIITIVIFDKQ